MTGEETGDRLEWLKKVVLTARNRLNSARRSLKSGPCFSDDFDFETPEAEAVLKEETVPPGHGSVPGQTGCG